MRPPMPYNVPRAEPQYNVPRPAPQYNAPRVEPRYNVPRAEPHYPHRADRAIGTRCASAAARSAVRTRFSQKSGAALRSALADARTFCLLVALGTAASACMAERHPSYNPPIIDQTGSIPMCPTISDPAAGVMIDTDVGAKLTPATGDSVSVEYSSGGLWHVQSTCLSGYACEWEVTAEVFNGSVSNVAGEDLETNDSVGSVCPDTAFMTRAPPPISMA